MARYDRLPPGLRRWLAQAALPWSAASALRIWQRACAEGADPQDRLARVEASMLARDAPRVWGSLCRSGAYSGSDIPKETPR